MAFAQNKITVTATLPEKLSIITPSTGLFTGTVVPLGSATAKTIYGYLLQMGASSEGLGFFLNGVNEGAVQLKGALTTNGV